MLYNDLLKRDRRSVTSILSLDLREYCFVFLESYIMNQDPTMSSDLLVTK